MLPELVSERLSLRPTTPADVPALLDIWNQPGVNRHLFDGEPQTREGIERRLAMLATDVPRGLGSWTVRRRSDDAIIGSAALMRAAYAGQFEPRLRGAYEPAIALREEAWRQGLGTEIARALATHAFGTVGLDALAAAVDVGNHASLRLVHKAGFRALSRVQAPAGPLITFILRPSDLRLES